MDEVVLTSALRTAQGDFGGTLKSLPVTELARLVIEEVVKGLDSASTIDKVIFGNCFSPLEQNVARFSAYQAGVPEHVPGFTINGACGSSMQAVISAAQAVQCGEAEVVLAGGAESMSNAPYIMESARWGQRIRHLQAYRSALESNAGVPDWCRDGFDRRESG